MIFITVIRYHCSPGYKRRGDKSISTVEQRSIPGDW